MQVLLLTVAAHSLFKYMSLMTLQNNSGKVYNTILHLPWCFFLHTNIFSHQPGKKMSKNADFPQVFLKNL